jgi:hypothetical protein
MQEEFDTEQAGRLLLVALCENLRCGEKVLVRALEKYDSLLGYKDIGRYRHRYRYIVGILTWPEPAMW